jgi:hydrogenase maturation protease
VSASRSGRPMLIGIGNRWRSDDAAGLIAARRARSRVPAGMPVVELEGEPVGLLDAWEDADAAVVVDAVRSGAGPGTIHRVDAHRDSLPEPVSGGASTHALGLAEAIELGRVLDRLPARLVVIGIESESFEAAEGLSARVDAAIEPAVELALDALSPRR